MLCTFICKPFATLSTLELHGLIWLREMVFVVGQKITAESEVDAEDPACAHMLGRDQTGRLVATARLRLDRLPVKAGRIAVHPDCQRRGIGRGLMAAIDSELAGRPAELHAQAHLEGWYAGLGWRREGANFVEAGIEHVRMVRGGDRATSDPLDVFVASV